MRSSAKRRLSKLFYTLIIFFIILFVLIDFVCATPARDVYVKITLQEQINASQNYTKFMLLKNNDYVSNVTDSLLSKVYLNLTKENSATKEVINWSISKTINSYSETGFGTLNVAEGIYFFCIYAEPSNYIDQNMTNNVDCKNLTTTQFYSNYSNQSNTNLTYNLTTNSTFNLTTNLTINLTINLTANSTFNLTANSTIDYTNDSESYSINYSTNNSANFTANNNSEYSFPNTSYNFSSNLSLEQPSNSSLNLSYNSSTNTSINFTNSTNCPVNYSTNSSFDNSTNTSINTSQNLSICACGLRIDTNKDIFSSGEHIEFKIFDCESAGSFNSSVEYWVEDSESIVKQKIITTSKAQKTYTPSIDVPEKYFLIKAKYVICDNISEKLVVFVSESASQDDQANFNDAPTSISIDVPLESEDDVIFATITGHKADTAKTLISAWLELDGKKFSTITKVYVNGKNSDFDFRIPLLLSVTKSGDYAAVAEGLDEHVEKTIHITRITLPSGNSTVTVAKTTKQSSQNTIALNSSNQTKTTSKNQTSAINKTTNTTSSSKKLNPGLVSNANITASKNSMTANVIKTTQKNKSVFGAGSLVFIVISCVFSFFFFNKKARAFVLQKTKLFK